MTDDDKKQINVLVDADTKEEWEQYVDDHDEYRYVTELVRHSVIKEINRDSDTAGGSSSEAVMQELGSIQNTIGDLVERSIIIDENVGEIKREVTQDPELTELANEVFRILPDDKDSVVEHKRETPGYPFQTGEVPSNGPKPSSIGEIATVLSEPELRVQEAVDQLREETYLVESIEINGEKHYYRND